VKEDPAMQIGFVGLGSMGGPMAANLVMAGFDVTVHDRDSARVASLVERGARPADGLAGLAAADIVLISVPGPPELAAVGAELLSNLAPGSVIINLSTVGVDSIRALATAAAESGIDVVDAPATGAADGARSATLTLMVGAEPLVLERVRPVFDAIASTVMHMGAVGTGSASKLLTNMLWFIHVVALSDAMAIAARSGMDPATFAQLVPQSAGASWVSSHDLPNLLADDDDESFTLALCCKDLRLIGRFQDQLGVGSDLAAAAADRFERALERYGPTRGELAVARLAETAMDVSIRANR
jgi:3-hydroxyisobutyrate dehydrogenase-like beta-hydroxyacid dehydrogenase